MNYLISGKELQDALNKMNFILSEKICERDNFVQSMYITTDKQVELSSDYLDLLLNYNEESDPNEVFQKLSLRDSSSVYFKRRTILDILLDFQKLQNLNKEISSLISLIKFYFKRKINKTNIDIRKLIFKTKVNINYRTEEDENMLSNVNSYTFFNNSNLNLWTLNNYKINLMK